MSDHSNRAAFPVSTQWQAEPQLGMDLRDWFATHAPKPTDDQMITERRIDHNRNPYNEPYKPALRSDCQIQAELAFRYADAMLAARQKVSS